MMPYLIQIMLAIIAGSLSLVFLTNIFAYEVSRILEGAFDEIEYRLAVKDQRRAKRVTARQIDYDATSSVRAELSL